MYVSLVLGSILARLTTISSVCVRCCGPRDRRPHREGDWRAHREATPSQARGQRRSLQVPGCLSRMLLGSLALVEGLSVVRASRYHVQSKLQCVVLLAGKIDVDAMRFMACRGLLCCGTRSARRAGV